MMDHLDERDNRLRAEIATLMAAGLTQDEARLIGLRRVGGAPSAPRRNDAMVAISLALAAAVIIKIPALFGLDLQRDGDIYARNAAIFVLPLLAGYFAWKRHFGARMVGVLAVPFILAAVFVNAYPFTRQGNTEVLSALHAAIALWLTVGVAYAGARWRQVDGRMDFIRFSGELFIYFVLIALGGGVFTGFMAMIFKAIGLSAEHFFQYWLLPCGAAGAVLIAAWLVETRQGVVENIAPMLARIFTPLFAALMLTFLAAVLWTGRGVGMGREVLIAFDLLLAVVLALLLYNLSARAPSAPAGGFDALQVVLLVSALLVDAVALYAIATRISEFGWSPNRVAALGENVILLVNLAWAAVLQMRFLWGKAGVERLEGWQTAYLPIYGAWAVIVVVVFPPVFGFV
jgi:hypothetical protein